MRAISNVLEPGSTSLTLSLASGLLGLYFVWRE